MMGKVLVALDKEHEDFLRRVVKEKEALDSLKEKERNERARQVFFRTIERGINLGFRGTIYKKRGELYE